MNNEAQLAVTVVVGTLLLLLLLGTVVLLLVVSSRRVHRHRAELVEADLRREQELLKAEREATRFTLHELATELHDNVGHLFTVAQKGVELLIMEGNKDERLFAVRETMELGSSEVRRLGRDLNTDLWKQRTLVDAINTEAERIERIGVMNVSVQVEGEAPKLPPGHTTILFRVLQEMVNNALKHSRARDFSFTVNGGPAWSIVVSDNGKGFDPATTKDNGGMVNIGSRCALIGLQAVCDTAPGKGCVWTLTPLPEHGT
jgi:signal transduction histidine kinase